MSFCLQIITCLTNMSCSPQLSNTGSKLPICYYEQSLMVLICLICLNVFPGGSIWGNMLKECYISCSSCRINFFEVHIKSVNIQINFIVNLKWSCIISPCMMYCLNTHVENNRAASLIALEISCAQS